MSGFGDNRSVCGRRVWSVRARAVGLALVIAAAAGGQPQPAASLSALEQQRLAAAYNAMTPAEQAQMRQFYKDLGIDLAAAVPAIKAAAAVTGPAKAGKDKGSPLVEAIRGLSFVRKPALVLAARSQLGFAASTMPELTNVEAASKWIHQNVMAGEWGALTQLLSQLSADDAVAVYSHILRSTNEENPALLPEEVLVLADACPGEPAEWQLDVLSGLLKTAAGQYGKAPVLARLKEGTRLFGSRDDASRQRTVRLLVGAGLTIEAYDYLPGLEQAREVRDARVIYAHARYHEDLVATGRAGDAGDEHLRQAWDLLGEVSLMTAADLPLRKEAAKRAIDMMSSMPQAQATQWLTQVFADQTLGPAALENVALLAMSFRDKKTDGAKKAQAIATMKAAVDTLIAGQGVDAAALRVPLRMLTTAMADEVDAVVKEKGEIRGVAKETELLFRASPDERWLGAIEPSVAIRGYRAAISVATIADETDAALDVLTNAMKRFPDQGADFANEFLVLWEKRLNPKAKQGEAEDEFMFFWRRNQIAAAPLTRGRQRRNVERLERLVTLLEGMGIKGRELPSVTPAFKACHARTEVFERERIERVFGPISGLSSATAASLAESMRSGLSGDWRSRQAQRNLGMMRSAAEINELVEHGYELAIELADRASRVEPDSWRNAVLHAALSYERVQFKQTQKKDDPATYNEYLRQSFAAFEQAAAKYAELYNAGRERENVGPYLQWFGAVMELGQSGGGGGSSTEEKDQTQAADEQITRIGSALRGLPGEAAQRHISAFARTVLDGVGQSPPERKPTLVQAALRVVGDHPAGAALRRLGDFYDDLLKNEIRLRLVIDGSDQVASKKVFGVMLALRYTNSVDRETGGFDKYLQQDAYVRIGNQYRMMNYQAQIRKGLETSLGQSFTVESIGFFEPMTPSRAVKEDGDPGWQEKPIAYILLRAKDPSVDRLPQVSFDMHFDDQTGPITLPIVSNSPPIVASAGAGQGEGVGGGRPIRKLEVRQTLDARRLISDEGDKAVTLEVYAKAEGVIPDIRELLDGLETALPGYAIPADGIEERPYGIIQAGEGGARPFWRQDTEDDKTLYPTADETGLYRLPGERAWLVTYKPTGAGAGSAFELPRLRGGVTGAVVSKSYSDLDLVEVKAASIALSPRTSWLTIAVWVAMLGALLGLAAWLLRRHSAEAEPALAGPGMPERITPLSTLVTMQRVLAERGETLDAASRAALAGDIVTVQRECFGPASSGPPDEGRLRQTLERWLSAPHR